MSINKQSSVEFLIKQKEKWGLLINDDLRIAKAMHKEEFTKAYYAGYHRALELVEWKIKNELKIDNNE